MGKLKQLLEQLCSRPSGTTSDFPVQLMNTTAHSTEKHWVPYLKSHYMLTLSDIRPTNGSGFSYKYGFLDLLWPITRPTRTTADLSLSYTIYFTVHLGLLPGSYVSSLTNHHSGHQSY